MDLGVRSSTHSGDNCLLFLFLRFSYPLSSLFANNKTKVLRKFTVGSWQKPLLKPRFIISMSMSFIYTI